MQIDKLDIYMLQEMMGTEATEREAYAMMGILSRECITDTDDIPESNWIAYKIEAIAKAENY